MYAQYNPNGTKMHFNGNYDHTMHKFPQHFENVSDFNVNNRSEPHQGNSQTHKEMRKEFKDIGKKIALNHCSISFTLKAQSKMFTKITNRTIRMKCMNSLNFD
jgi:ribosomal protein L9